MHGFHLYLRSSFPSTEEVPDYLMSFWEAEVPAPLDAADTGQDEAFRAARGAKEKADPKVEELQEAIDLKQEQVAYQREVVHRAQASLVGLQEAAQELEGQLEVAKEEAGQAAAVLQETLKQPEQRMPWVGRGWRGKSGGVGWGADQG